MDVHFLGEGRGLSEVETEPLVHQVVELLTAFLVDRPGAEEVQKFIFLNLLNLRAHRLFQCFPDPELIIERVYFEWKRVRFAYGVSLDISDAHSLDAA